MRGKISTFWFIVGVFFVAWAVMAGFQKISPYLMPGRVEYDSGQGWAEFQILSRNADIRNLLVKRVGSDVPSMTWTIRQPIRSLGRDNFTTQTETYTLPAGASFKEFVIQRSPMEGIRLVSAITHQGTAIQIFSDGVQLDDGVYSISTKDKVFQDDMFKLENGELYFAGN